MLSTGDKVPRLKGALEDGGTLDTGDFRGKPYVVYFYPKDATPGCTREAEAFRDLYAKFKKKGCEIVGVSRDSAASHAKFRGKYELPFPLVADTDETWCNAFGAIGEKVLYGKRHVGVIRSTFLIGAGGRIAAEWRNVKAPGHAEAVLERLSGQ